MKKLSYNLTQEYNNQFNRFNYTSVDLDGDSINDFFHVSKDEIKESIKEAMLIEFKCALNAALYGDPAVKIN